MRANIAQLVAEAWDQELREAPWDGGSSLFDMLEGIRRTYREQLDRQPRNYHGELIPRIVTVRRNLRHLGSIRLDSHRIP